MDVWIDSLIGAHIELLVLFRVVLAILLGAILGLERELYKRPAGLRTHILVCVASCLIMLVSMYGFDGEDPARMAAQVVSGIGFLGAGAIMKEEKGVIGITTAATIWVSAMIGLACGNGFYFGAVLVAVLALVILTILRKVESRISSISKEPSKVFFTAEMKGNMTTTIRKILKECNLLANDIDSKIIDDGKFVKFEITFEMDCCLETLYDFAEKLEKEYSPVELRLFHE
jgi:putative Mg2+ transporter-C (MgtC) family protein